MYVHIVQFGITNLPPLSVLEKVQVIQDIRESREGHASRASKKFSMEKF